MSWRKAKSALLKLYSVDERNKAVEPDPEDSCGTNQSQDRETETKAPPRVGREERSKIDTGKNKTKTHADSTISVNSDKNKMSEIDEGIQKKSQQAHAADKAANNREHKYDRAENNSSARKDSVNTELNSDERSTKNHRIEPDKLSRSLPKHNTESQGERTKWECWQWQCIRSKAIKSSGHATMQTEQAKRSEVVSETISSQPSKGDVNASWQSRPCVII